MATSAYNNILMVENPSQIAFAGNILSHLIVDWILRRQGPCRERIGLRPMQKHSSASTTHWHFIIDFTYGMRLRIVRILDPAINIISSLADVASPSFYLLRFGIVHPETD
jgi:hypothetical protein